MSNTPNNTTGPASASGAAEEPDQQAIPEDLSTTREGATKASALMASGTLVSRILGFVRTSLLAVAIGSTALVADVFEQANTIPNVIYMLLAGGVFNVVLIPQLIKAAKAPDRGADYTSRILTLTALILGAFTIALTLCAYPVMSALTLDWSEPQLQLAVSFAYWTLPQVFFYGMYAMIGQILNAHGRFGAFMWAPVVNNLVAIAVIVIYIFSFGHYTAISDAEQLATWTTGQTVLLAGGHTLGIIIQALVLLWPLKALRLGLRPKFGWKGMGLRTTGKLAFYTIISMVIGNLGNLLINRVVTGATEARTGLEVSAEAAASVPGLYALNLAQLITVLPHSVFVLSIATVLFNQLTRSMQSGDRATARELTARGLSNFAIPMVFFMVVVIVLAGPIGRIFAGSAETAIASAIAIGEIILLLALGMPFRSAHFYLMRVFYAAENAKTPMLVQVFITTISLIALYGLAVVVPNRYLAHLVAIIFTVTHIIQFILCHFLVRRDFGPYNARRVADTYVRTGYAAVGSGIIGVLVMIPLGGFSFGFAYDSILSALITCAIVGLVMLIAFIILARAMKIREVDEYVGPILNRLGINS